MSFASDLARLVTSGSTAIHGEAGVTSSGSTGKTTNLQQGLTKVWYAGNHNSGAISATDSFSVGSYTDVAYGVHAPNFTNNFAAANYVSAGIHGGDTGIATYTATNWYDASMYTTSKSRTGCYNVTGSAYADRDFSVARFGDLA